MFTFRFTKPSRRVSIGLVFFLVAAYIAGKLEHFIVPGTIHFLRNHLHFSFSAIFGPKPAVAVNLLTTIVVIRSLYALVITWIALEIDGRPWSAVGYSSVGAIRSYAYGLIAAFLAISVLMSMMWFSHALVFDGLRLHGSDIVTYGLRWLIGLLLVGIAEECVDRGYALVSIAQIFGVLPAVLLTSFVFAAGHAGNPGETFLGLLQVFLFGAVCALSVFRTGSLWWAVGFHGMWDWTQEFFFGTLGSGYWYDGHLFQFRPQGNEILSGGTVGPEGSIYVFVILGGLMAYELIWHYRHSDKRFTHPLETAL